jgi:3-hydroxyisobutyrate dehydrogenase/glyoxylate/succinic semialdehyde reductase
MDVAFIGLGIMGSRMARNLLGGGHRLSVFNRSPGKTETLAREGARVAPTAAEAAKGVEVLFTMLSNPAAVSATALGKNGFLDALGKGSLWVDCSTVNPSFSRQMASESGARGIRFVDAPVTGSLPFAEKAELTFLVGAEPKDLENCRPLLQLMGKTIRHLGGTGMGASMKMVINMQLGTLMAVFSEALAFGESLGFSRSALMDILIGGAVAGPFLAGKRSNLETHSYNPEFPLRWQHKDLQLASATAYENGIPMPVINAAKEVYAQAAASGLKDLDFSAVAELYRRRD